MSAVNSIKDLIGNWEGTNQLWLDPAEDARKSNSIPNQIQSAWVGVISPKFLPQLWKIYRPSKPLKFTTRIGYYLPIIFLLKPS